MNRSRKHFQRSEKPKYLRPRACIPVIKLLSTGLKYFLNYLNLGMTSAHTLHWQIAITTCATGSPIIKLFRKARAKGK